MKLLTPAHDHFRLATLHEIELFGSDGGTNERADIVTQTLDGTDLNAMWDEFQATLDIWNRDRSALMNLLTFPVQNPVESILLPGGDDFEEASEYGEPVGMRTRQPRQTLGYSFKWYDLAIRYTWMFLAESTTAQVEALNNAAIEADNRLLFNQVLRRLFRTQSEIANINDQPVNVYPFYNGDGTVPPPYKNNTFAGTHTHFLASGAATIDAGDLDDMEEHLRHHGYTPQAGYQYVLLVNRQEAQVIRRMRVSGGATYDFVPDNDGSGAIILEGQVINRPTGTVPGQIGTVGPWHVVEEEYIPAGYVVGFVTGGDRNFSNPIGVREHANTQLRGLRLVKGRDNDYPLVDSFYQHGFGTGVRHRGGGVVMQITINASYTPPAAYA